MLVVLQAKTNLINTTFNAKLDPPCFSSRLQHVDLYEVPCMKVRIERISK